MDKRIKLGVFGAGGILGAHAPALRGCQDRCVVTAIAEPVAAKHGRARELLGADVAIYPDYRSLLAESDVDAVDILLPHDMHAEATLAAADAGRHVLVEKVMARNIYECDRMIEACERAGVTLTVCHDRRYHAEWMALKRVVESGLLGEVLFWKLDHNQDVDPAKALPWAASRDRLGGGAIMSCLTHQTDALRWYGGEVESVTCMGKVIADRMEGESIGAILARMRSGALAQLSINWVTRQHERGPHGLWYEMVQVCGARGEAYYMSGRGVFARSHVGDPVARYVDVDGPAPERGFVKVKTGDWTGHARCISEWLNMLLGREHGISTNGREARGAVEVAEAAYLAERTGRVVCLPIEPVPWGGT